MSAARVALHPPAGSPALNMITHATSPLPSKEEALSIPTYAVAASSPILGGKGSFPEDRLVATPTVTIVLPVRCQAVGTPGSHPSISIWMASLGRSPSWHWILKGLDVLVPSIPVSSRFSVTGIFPAQKTSGPADQPLRTLLKVKSPDPAQPCPKSVNNGPPPRAAWSPTRRPSP